MIQRNQPLFAKAAIAGGAGIWGLFWIPLRYLDSLGIKDFAAIGLISFFSCIAATVIAIAFRDFKAADIRNNLIVGVGFGLSMVLYFAGVLISDVIRVIFLFYLLPVWTTIFAKLIYGEPIGLLRTAAIGLALFGLSLLLNEGTGFPFPQNAGDFCGLSAGIIWGLCLVFIRGKRTVGAFANTVAIFAFALLFSTALALISWFFDIQLSGTGTASVNTLTGAGYLNAILFAFVFGVFVLWPAMIGQIWGARLVPAPTTALLTMTEILFASASATIMIGTSLSAVSLIGGGIIILAVLIDLRATWNID